MSFFSAKSEYDIDTLINNGVDINMQDLLFGQTYLHTLVQSESPLLDYFLSKGPNPNIQNKDGKTPLYYAKTETVIKKLISNGASPLIKDVDAKEAIVSNILISKRILQYYLENIRV